MQLVFPDEGLVYTLQRIAGNTADAVDGLVWVVYVNDVTPGRATVLADLTLDDTNFPDFEKDSTDLATTSVSSDVGAIQGSVINFVNGSSGPIDVYGYAITDHAGTMLIAAARLDTAPTSVPAAGVLPVLPIIYSRSFLP